jgi:hypothetical protein
MTTCEQSELPFPESISSAEDSRARMCHPREIALGLMDAARASGVSSLVSSRKSAPSGSSSRTSQAEQSSGSTLWCATWGSLAMRAFRSRCQRLESERRTYANASSLWPTPTASAADKGGRGELLHAAKAGDPNHRRGLLPTPIGNMLAPSMQKWPAHQRLLATPRAADAERGATKRTRTDANAGAGTDLPTQVGGRLNPAFVEWMMGFPIGWTELDPSVTRSCLNVLKSLGTS